MGTISGTEAIVQFALGNMLTNDKGYTYYMKGTKLHGLMKDGRFAPNITVEQVLKMDWHPTSSSINSDEKKFDIRKEMYVNPDKWVGAFEDQLGHFWKVGLNHQQVQVYKKRLYLGKDTPGVSINHSEQLPADVTEIDQCISIGDMTLHMEALRDSYMEDN